MKGWEKVRLGKVLMPVSRPVAVQSDVDYRQIGIRSHGKGLFHKAPVSGLDLGNKKVFWVKPGDFVLNIVFAWEGAIALMTDREDGMIGSHRFPSFRPDIERLSSRFLLWFFRTPQGVELLGRVSPGGAGRNRTLSRKGFLALEIPLPPLAEQRRIVARIQALAAQIDEAKRLRQEAVEEAQALHLAYLHEAFQRGAVSWDAMAMEDAIQITARQVDPTLPEYAQFPHISGENMESSTCKLLPWRTVEADGVKSGNYLFQPNSILYSKIRPYLRKAVFVDFKGLCSADVYPVEILSPLLDARFVMWSLVAQPFTDYANRVSGRTRMPKLNRKQLFAYSFSFPPLPEQRRIVAELDALQREVDSLKRLQAETAAELDALLPAILDRAFKGEL